MGCNSKLSKDMLRDCAISPKAGVENSGQAILINFEDIDRGGSTVSGATINDLVLNTGTSGFILEYYKQLASGSASYAQADDVEDGFQHSGMFRLSSQTADSAERSKELKDGLYVVVLKTKFEGAGQADAYKVFGWENGMVLSELTTNTNESGGSVLFTLSTEGDAYEKYPFNVFHETSYSASTASFASAFAQA